MNRPSRRCWAPHSRARARLRPPPSPRRPSCSSITALETDQLKAYTESFKRTNPNIDLKFVRDSTGVITAEGAGREGESPRPT
jgi:hypothetical protein